MGMGTPMRPLEPDTWLPARRRLWAGMVAGIAAGAAATLFAAWQVSALVAWCAGCATLLVLAWATMLGADSERTRSVAVREDETRFSADVIVLVASVASLVAVGLILIKASRAHGASVALMTGLGVVSVLLAWGLVHTVFTLRYAHLYYAEGDGIDFNQEEDPDYRDFAYLAFTIGMTYQVSDTNLRTKKIRHAALRHALLSYLFGTAIIAVTINIVAGLAH